MRQGSNKQRSRGRSNRRQGGPNLNRAFDSNGPSGKLRGTAAQLVEKYVALGRDARSGRDRVLVENYLQHAEHYQRIINESAAAQAKARDEASEQQPEVSDQPAAAPKKREKKSVNGAADDEQPEVTAEAEPQEPSESDENDTPPRRQRRSRRSSAQTTDDAPAESAATPRKRKDDEEPVAEVGAPE